MSAPAHANSLATGDPFAEFADFVQRDFPLARYTWFRVGGSARYFAQPRSLEELQAISRRCEETRTPVYVLGLGANLLVSDDGVPGMVVRLGEDHWRQIKIERDGNGKGTLTVGAGADLQKLLLRACRDGLSGIECMAGIPGTVGGGIRMNAGGKFGDFGANVLTVTVMGPDGTVFDRHRDDLVFEYRRSNIIAPFILSATLELIEEDPDVCTKRTKEIWMYKNSTQPLNTKSAGCMFKNPRGLSAGSLIDRAGCKGLRIGQAEVSEKHANFIIAHPGCGSAEIEKLVAEIRQRVLDKHGVELESEVKRWP